MEHPQDGYSQDWHTLVHKTVFGNGTPGLLREVEMLKSDAKNMQAQQNQLKEGQDELIKQSSRNTGILVTSLMGIIAVLIVEIVKSVH